MNNKVPNFESGNRREVLDVSSLESLKQFSEKETLESKEEYLKSIKSYLEATKHEQGIVELKNQDIPTIVISDLHTRRDFLYNTLSQKSATGVTVLDLLKQGKINVVCLGDIMHSEQRVVWDMHVLIVKHKADNAQVYQDNKEEWDQYLEDNRRYNKISHSIQVKKRAKQDASKEVLELTQLRKRVEPVEAKMVENVMEAETVHSLGLAKMIMDLKVSFSDNFHCVRGNHDAIKGMVMPNGERGMAGKYGAEQTVLQSKAIEKLLGEDVVDQYAEFEDQLPLVIKSKNVVAMHSAPREALSAVDINSRTPKATESITWARREEEPVVDGLLANLKVPNSRLFVGHTNSAGYTTSPEGKYIPKLYHNDFNNKLIRINNDWEQVIAFVPPDNTFDPDKHVFNVKDKEGEVLGVLNHVVAPAQKEKKGTEISPVKDTIAQSLATIELLEQGKIPGEHSQSVKDIKDTIQKLAVIENDKSKNPAEILAEQLQLINASRIAFIIGAIRQYLETEKFDKIVEEKQKEVDTFLMQGNKQEVVGGGNEHVEVVNIHEHISESILKAIVVAIEDLTEKLEKVNWPSNNPNFKKQKTQVALVSLTQELLKKVRSSQGKTGAELKQLSEVIIDSINK